MRIYIAKEEDRIQVAAVLVKNGYTVRQGKDAPQRGIRVNKSYIEIVRDVKHDEQKEDL